jgi:hypothetical protein
MAFKLGKVLAGKIRVEKPQTGRKEVSVSYGYGDPVPLV